MKSKLSIIIIACAMLLSISMAVRGQDREKLRTPLPLSSEAVIVNQDITEAATFTRQPEAPCQVAMTLLYETLGRYLNEGGEATTQGLRGAVQTVIASDSDLVVIRLNERAQPDIFVGYSCNIEVSKTYATFRVFHFDRSNYIVAARSEDYPLLATRTAEGLSIDEGSLEASALFPSEGGSQSGYIATIWTQGGGRPAPFSVVVWRWDGDALRAVWQKLEVRNGTVKLVSPLIVIAAASKTAVGLSDVAAYRLDGTGVVSDGILTPKLLQRYTDSQILKAVSTEELASVGYLWEAVGQPQRATASYEQAISKDTKVQNTYLYLSIADIYERTGKAAQSAKILRAYQRAAKSQLSTSSNKAIEDRIQRLQTVTPER